MSSMISSQLTISSSLVALLLILNVTSYAQTTRPFMSTSELLAALTRGKPKVTVRFQAQPGHVAGELFGFQTLRQK